MSGGAGEPDTEPYVAEPHEPLPPPRGGAFLAFLTVVLLAAAVTAGVLALVFASREDPALQQPAPTPATGEPEVPLPPEIVPTESP